MAGRPRSSARAPCPTPPLGRAGASERAKARSPRSLSGLLPFLRPYRLQIALALAFLLLGLLFVLNSVPVNAGWALLAAWMSRREAVRRGMHWLDKVAGVMFIVFGIRLALADRFGLSVGFHNCTQDDYLAIIAGYCADLGLPFDDADALEWAKRRGARSGRVAWHYVTELAGRAGQAL